MRSSVLVVEDEPLIRLDTVMMLEAAGLSVAEFDNAVEAADYLAANAACVAAIFTDISLKGGMNGIELAQLALATAPTVLLLVTSGRYAERPADLPDDIRFLKKPWLPLDVLTALQHAVEDHGRTGP
jgi:CheY-like chemotaxis protein